MKNHPTSPADVITLSSADIIQAATLVAGALNSGRVRLNPDGSFIVDGLPLLAHPVPAGGGQTRTEEELVNQFQFDGKTWTLQFDRTVVFEPDRLGLQYIRRLIERKGGELHVNKMVTMAYGEAVDVMTEAELLQDGVAVEEQGADCDGNPCFRVVTTEFRDEILSDEDRGIVLDILEKYEWALVRLKIRGWPEPIKQKELEIEQIKDYLRKTRFKRKNICFAGRAESDRKSVAKAIKQAIDKIAKKHPALAEHLRESIKTGDYCSYKPETTVRWEVGSNWVTKVATD